MEPVNQRIQTLIEDLGESNNRFAQRVDTSSAVVSHIVTGRNRPNLELIQKILRALPNLRPQWLVLGEGGMYYPDEGDDQSSNHTTTNSSTAPDEHSEAPPQASGLSSTEPDKELKSNEAEDVQQLMRNMFASQRMMLRSMEQHMAMQEKMLDWIIKQNRNR